MKDALESTFGFVGIVLWYILSVAFVAIPIFATGLPIWAIIVIWILINYTMAIGAFVTVAVYVYAFIVVFNRPLDWLSIVFFIDAAIYFACFFIPAVRSMIGSAVNKNRSA